MLSDIFLNTVKFLLIDWLHRFVKDIRCDFADLDMTTKQSIFITIPVTLHQQFSITRT